MPPNDAHAGPACLSGKVVLVTGAQQGIGAAAARAFALKGATVIVNWLDDERGAETVGAEAEQLGGRASLVRADVSSPADIARMFSEIEHAHGRLDVLVNNAGIFPRRPFLEMSENDWDTVVGVNLKGTFLCSQAAARVMVAGGTKGAIVNVSSGALRGKRLGVHYSASKAGMIGMTRSMALELAPHGIRVNAVSPGLTDTAQPRVEHDEIGLRRLAAEIPLGRMGDPADVADVIVFLASAEARFVTGQNIFVNGGSYMR